MVTAIRRRTKPTSTPQIDMVAVREYLQAREDEASASKVLQRVKPALNDFVRDNGYEGPDGHQYVDLPVPVGKIGALQRRRNVGKPYIDTERATDILHTRDCWEECSEVVVTIPGDLIGRVELALSAANLTDVFTTRTENISEERVLAYHALHPDRLSLDDIFEMTTEKITYAFWPVESLVVA